MSVVSLRDVRKSFAGTPVLKGINFAIEEGEMISLLGPSGCGKTTTLRCIAGFETIDSGEIRINDKLVSGAGLLVPPEKRKLGIVFQSYAIWPHMSLFENVAFGLELQRLPKAVVRARVESVLAMVGLAGLEGRYPAALSGGQQQRVAIARSLVVEPSVLLFDEPLSNLDAQLRDRMRDEIRSIQQRVGTTAIYVTHDQTEAMSMSDRIMLMHGGEVVESGKPRELYERPRTQFAAQFLGAANIWRAEAIPAQPQGGTARLRLTNGATLLTNDVISTPGACLAMVRPGAIRLRIGASAAPAGGQLTARLHAQVSKVSFLGESTEVVCDVEGVEANVVIESRGLPTDFARGVRCMLDIAAEHVRVLDLAKTVADAAPGSAAMTREQARQ